VASVFALTALKRRTGADSFAYWRVDNHGITLFVNLCCGNEGVNLIEPLLALEVVELFGEKNEDRD
jgi:hypothetical protein